MYDGSSSHSGPLKVKKPEGSIVSIGSNDRLKPPPAANLSNPIRKLSGNTSSSPSSQRSSDTKNLKLEENTSVGTSLLSYSCTKKVIHECSYCLCVWRYSKESVRTFIIKKIILFLKKKNMQFIMPVYVLSSIVLGGTEVSGSEEQDPACDLALIFGLFFIQT